MKSLAILIIVLVVIGVVFFLPGPGSLKALYFVDETQLAIKTRFGKPVGNSITTPGLRMKVPFVDRVEYFERRLLVFDAPPRDLFTQDEERLKIDVFARARIFDPLKFWTTVRTEEEAATTAIGIIASELRQEIGRNTLPQIIATKRSEIMGLVREAVAPQLRELGIELVDLRIKRADFPVEGGEQGLRPDELEPADSGERGARRGRARGPEDAGRGVPGRLSRSGRRPSATRPSSAAAAESEAITIFADALERDPEFYSFQRSLEVYRVYLAQNATLIGSGQDLGELFEEIRQTVIKASAPPSGTSDEESIVSTSTAFEPPCVVETKSRLFLSDELGLAPQTTLALNSARQVDWPNASLGCPVEGQVYADVITPGFALVFELQGQTYEVHTDREATQLVRCLP